MWVQVEFLSPELIQHYMGKFVRDELTEDLCASLERLELM